MTTRERRLSTVMRIDGWLSFAAPTILLAGVPLLLLVGAPGWLVAGVVLALAVVLGACGAVFATMLAMEAARGRYEFPEAVLRDLES
jgi:O-antigen/teichoic acid export membrane protein